jgi:hypothetical protein
MSAEEHRHLFMQRWEAMRAANLTHPWARWIAIDGAKCAAPCRALHGKVWLVDSAELALIIRDHLDAQHPNCACRLSPQRKP